MGEVDVTFVKVDMGTIHFWKVEIILQKWDDFLPSLLTGTFEKGIFTFEKFDKQVSMQTQDGTFTKVLSTFPNSKCTHIKMDIILQCIVQNRKSGWSSVIDKS